MFVLFVSTFHESKDIEVTIDFDGFGIVGRIEQHTPAESSNGWFSFLVLHGLLPHCDHLKWRLGFVEVHQLGPRNVLAHIETGRATQCCRHPQTAQ